MPSSYPSGYDSFNTHHDNVGERVTAGDVNKIQDAIGAIQTSVGLNPARTYVQRAAGTSSPAAPLPFFNVRDYGAVGNARYGTGTVIQGQASLTSSDTSFTVSDVGLPMSIIGAGPLISTPTISSVTTATTGGSLASNTTYSYRVSAVNEFGETLASIASTVAVPTGTSTNTATVSFAAVYGAASYNIYGRTSGSELLTGSVAYSGYGTLTFTDTGSATPSGALPSSGTAYGVLHTTIAARNSANSITLADAASVSASGCQIIGGADDAAAIQAAISAAVSAGRGIVYIPPGVYRLTTELTLSSSNVTIMGAGTGNTTLVLRPGVNTRVLAVNPGSVGSLGFLSDVKVAGLTLNQMGAWQSSSTSDNSQVGALSAVLVRRIQVTNCRILNSRDHGINLRRCDDYLIDGNTIDTCTYGTAANGINAMSVAQNSGDPLNWAYFGGRVCNNVVHNAWDIGIDVTDNGQGGQIAGNVVEGGRVGIFTEGGNGGTGATAARGGRLTISGNAIRNASLIGLRAADTSATGNTQVTVENTTLTGNFVSGCPTGAELVGRNITFAANTLDKSTTAGIQIARSARGFDEASITVTGNNVRYTSGAGITAIKANATNSLYGLIVSGNTVELNGAGSASGGYGILIQGNVTDFSIQGNVVLKPALTGIRVTNDSTTATVPTRGLIFANVVRDPNQLTSAADVDGSGISFTTVTSVGAIGNRIADATSKMRWCFTQTGSNPALFLTGNFTTAGTQGTFNTTFTSLIVEQTTFNGKVTFSNAAVYTRVAQTLAANGAVTINALAGNVQVITLNANATSSSISNAATGQPLTISWLQDATGGRTYAWPSNCKFVGGSAPSDTTASKQTNVTFFYDGTNWIETARAVAVG